MLARVADSLFWMARYMERAAATARILGIARLVPAPASSDAVKPNLWETLIDLSGDRKRFSGRLVLPDPRSAVEFLAFREDNPHSIVSCVRTVREHARGIRDRISRELWDDIDAFHSTLVSARVEPESEPGGSRFCRTVTAGACRFDGLARDTLPFDETWHFLEAGRSLERAVSSARIVGVAFASAELQLWAAVLEALSAYDAYRRRYQPQVRPDRAAELLLLDPSHPRSVRFNLLTLGNALHAIGGVAGNAAEDPERCARRLAADLAARPFDAILAAGLHEFLTGLQRQCRSIGERIARAYFHYPAPA